MAADTAARDHRLLSGIAVALAAVLAIVGVVLRDREAVAFAVLTLVGVALLRVRRGLAGRILLGLLFVDTAAWLVPAAVANTADHDRFGSIVLPIVISALAVVGLVAVLSGRRDRPRLTPAVATLVWVALTVGALGAAAGVGVGRTTTLPPGTVTLSARNTAFSTKHLRLVETAGGMVTVQLNNHDLFWHTFSVEGLGVDLKVPSGGRRHVTFRAKPGTYTFYCSIPGHRAAGMEGTLVVKPAVD